MEKAFTNFIETFEDGEVKIKKGPFYYQTFVYLYFQYDKKIKEL